jgi:hypothetical protein
VRKTQHGPEPEPSIDEASAEYRDASRQSASAQEALGAAEDELIAAEAGQDEAERVGSSDERDRATDDRLESAEKEWDARIADAGRATDRRREAEHALNDAHAKRGPGAASEQSQT